MSIAVDHLIVSARDQRAAAECLASILGVAWSPTGVGPFSSVYVSDDFTLDFIDDPSAFPIQHVCFRVTDAEFDAIRARLVAANVAYRSSPHGEVDMQVDTSLGGRILYWSEPDGHYWEILTRSYARKPSGTAATAG